MLRSRERPIGVGKQPHAHERLDAMRGQLGLDQVNQLSRCQCIQLDTPLEQKLDFGFGRAVLIQVLAAGLRAALVRVGLGERLKPRRGDIIEALRWEVPKKR
jgi:hypothetical protein